MIKRRTVLLPLHGPVGCLAQGYRDWAVTTVAHDYMVSSVEAIINTGSLLPFIEAVLYEIFKEHYLSSYIDDEPESNKIFRLWGMPEDVARNLKGEFLDSVVGLIYTHVPDLNMSTMSNHDYGMSTNSMMVMHIQEEVNERLHGNVFPSTFAA